MLMCTQKLGGEPGPGIPQQDTHGRLPSAWPVTTPRKAGTETSREGPQKEVGTIRLCQRLSPYLKAVVASPHRPSAPGWWLLGGQELVRLPGRARDVGWHWPPRCPLRNWWAQPERSGMSQPPCQGQQEGTSTATGLAPSLAQREAPLTSRVSGSWSRSSLEFSLPGHSPEGDGRRTQGPAPRPCRGWQLLVGPRYVEQKSAAPGSGPRVRSGPGSRPKPTLPCIGPSARPRAARRVESPPQAV